MQSAVEQQDDENDDCDEAETTARIIAPTAAVGQNWRRTEREQQENDQQNKHGVNLTDTELVHARTIAALDAVGPVSRCKIQKWKGGCAYNAPSTNVLQCERSRSPQRVRVHAARRQPMFLVIAGVLFLVWILGEVFTHGASLLIHILAIVWVISLVGGLFTRKS